LGWLFVLVFAGRVLAEPDSDMRFSVKPRLCVLAQDEESCHDVLEIRWSTRDKKSLCLFQSSKRLPLRCWEDEREGSHTVEIHTGEDIDFQLQEVGANELLVSQSYEVVQDQEKYRRRRRNPWSFF
jgi:hypothetical protein